MGMALNCYSFSDKNRLQLIYEMTSEIVPWIFANANCIIDLTPLWPGFTVHALPRKTCNSGNLLFFHTIPMSKNDKKVIMWYFHYRLKKLETTWSQPNIFSKKQTFCVCFDFAENELGIALICFSFLDKSRVNNWFWDFNSFIKQHLKLYHKFLQMQIRIA